MFLVILAGLFLRLIVLFNTTEFYDLSEAGAMFRRLSRLMEGDKVFLFEWDKSPILAYIMYYFHVFTGNYKWFFVLQAVVASISAYVAYLIIFEISQSKSKAMVGLIMVTFYADYILLTPVAYNQIFEIFFTLISVFLIMKLTKSISIGGFIVYLLLFAGLLWFSLFFKDTVTYFYVLMLILAGYALLLKKEPRVSLRLISLAIIAFIAVGLVSPRNYFTRPGDTVLHNDFIMFGHTDYGGHGGEGGFVYPENRDRYDSALDAYLLRNNIENPSRQDINNFQMEEIRRFVFNSPFDWMMLQFKKLLYTYGALPVKDNFVILMSGHVNPGIYFSMILVQITFFIPILLLVIFFDWRKLRELSQTYGGFLLILVFFYLLAATTFYGHYAERYRIVVMVCAIIPLLATFLSKSHLNRILTSKKLRYQRMAIIVAVLFLWGYQLAEVFLHHGDRFDAMIQSVH